MSPRTFLTAYGLVALIFLGLDAVWLGTMGPALYQPRLGHLLAEQVVWPAAALFYALYIGGIVVFAVGPGLRAQAASTALRLGAFLGLLAYATYDLTNQATMKDWPWLVTGVDLVWGTVVTGIAAGGACALLMRRAPR